MKQYLAKSLVMLAVSFAIGVTAVALTPSSARADELIVCDQMKAEASAFGCTVYSAICHDLDAEISYVDYTLYCDWL